MRESFDEIYQQHSNEIRAFLASRIRNFATVDDLSQQVWISLFNNLNTFDHKNIRGWLFKVAKHKIIDFFRSRKSQQPLDDYDPPVDIAVVDDDSEQLALQTCLEQLDQTQRAMFTLRSEGQSYQEIAGRMNIVMGTVASRISRIKEQLQICILKRMGK